MRLLDFGATTWFQKGVFSWSSIRQGCKTIPGKRLREYARYLWTLTSQTFAVVLYDLPNDGEEKDRMLQTLNEEILALDEVINETKAEITQNLSYFADIHSELLVNE